MVTPETSSQRLTSSRKATADVELGWTLISPGSRGSAAIANSSYSQIGPFDVSLLGALAYIAILILVIVKATSEKPAFVDTPAWLVATMTTFGFAYSWYLQYVAKYILRGFCINCRLSAIAMTILFALSLFEVSLILKNRRRPGAPTPDFDPSI